MDTRACTLTYTGEKRGSVDGKSLAFFWGLCLIEFLLLTMNTFLKNILKRILKHQKIIFSIFQNICCSRSVRSKPFTSSMIATAKSMDGGGGGGVGGLFSFIEK